MRKISKYIKRQIGNNSGFSLLEMVIATAVSSMILLLVYSAHKSIMTSVYELTGIADFYETVNMAIQRIDKDLAYMYINKTNNNNNTCFVGENDNGNNSNGRIYFVTTDYTEMVMAINPKKPYPKSDIRGIGYALKPDKRIPGLFYLARREKNSYDDTPESGGDESMLLENVVDVKFEFWQRNSWVDKWDSRTDKKWPQAVKTTLKVKNYRKNEEDFVFISYVNSANN